MKNADIFGELFQKLLKATEPFDALMRAQDEQTRLNTETIEKAFQAQEEAGE